jgi:PAS domain S-box-containing protein
LNISLVRDRREAPLYFIIQIENIDERKRTEDALRESEARLRAIIDHEPECVKLVDRNGNLLEMNPAGLRIIEADSMAQVEGHCVYPLVAEEYREAYRRLHERVLRGESGSLVFDIISLKGARRTIETHETPLLDPSGTVFAALGITHDITNRRKAEEALRESSQFNQQIIANAREGIIVYDRDLRYVVWNLFMEEMTGLRAEIMLGKRPTDLPAMLRQHHGKIMLSQQAADGIEASLRRAVNGDTFTYMDVPLTNLETGLSGWTSARYGPFRNGRGEIIGAIAIIRDITERKRLEEQLRHAQKLEAIGQLAGGVAHEFNNMLTAIIGNLDLALGKIPPESDQHSTLTGALQAARRASMLTQQLLTFSHRTPMDPQPQDLDSIAKEVVHLLRQTIDRRIQVSVRNGNGLWPVLADSGQMHQVIMNLCVNARDSLMEHMQEISLPSTPTPWEPRIVIASENVRLDEADCKGRFEARPGEYVCLSVSDNGCGIDEEVRHHIFEPFFTTKEVGHGTGLGLAAVHGIIKQHEGWIELSSMKNLETTFKIYLPRTDRPAIPMPPGSTAEGIAGGTETILFVDDEASIRRLGQTILEHHGYGVLLAKNGEEALEVFQREQGRIRLVVLDLTMPRLSGRDVLKQLLRLDPKMRILISSGHQMPTDANELQRQGMIRFVPKPYRPDDLARSVRTLLDASAPA